MNFNSKAEKRCHYASLALFGFFGQVAWCVENSFLNLYVYRTITTDLGIVSAMVASSAVVATLTTIIMGWVTDRIGKRRPFMVYGYLLWGISVAAFALCSIQNMQTLFNLPETVALLQRGDTVPYWRHMLRHAADGNLQAVLDEYVHILRESLGLADCPPGEQAAKIAEHIRSVLSLRSAPLWTEELALKNGTFSFNSFSVRCRFALRFGDLRDDADQPLLRADTVREAFNSPFRPFVLASTSIGQEGLDFHRWCHAVVHWNLPANPVDMEQREGRVHRYKGHAVRKNLAEHYGLRALAEACDHENPGDPWQALFELAFRDAEAAGDASGLVPYWIFEEGSARVERRIPLPPRSREAVRLLRLRQGLALYRWVFGQPRQEDLLSSLSQEADGDGEWDDLLISLRPPPRS